MNYCRIGNLKLASPILNAAGSCRTVKYAQELQKMGVGAVVSKTCTPLARSPDNVKIHFNEFGGVNHVQLQNDGVREYYKWTQQLDIPHIMSLGGSLDQINESLMIVHTCCRNENINYPDLFEINMSCPNINSGMQGGEFADKLEYNLDQLLYFGVPFGIKLPIIFEKNNIIKIANAINSINLRYSRIQFITCSNTLPGILKKESEFIEGGISGKYIQPFAMRNVKYFRNYLCEHTTIIGCGGIDSEQDVADYLKLGAGVVQIGTGIRKINEIIDKFDMT